ncbi:MAG: winged helix-turn-helix domain-containing protein [Pseudomonadota bacterium]
MAQSMDDCSRTHSSATAEPTGARVALDQGGLTVDGVPRRLRPKSLKAAAHLIRHAGRPVSRTQLAEAVWPGESVSDDSITRCISDIRRALGPEARHALTTLPKRGYTFSRAALVDGMAEAQRPGIIVVPFATSTQDATLAFTGRALATELIHGLSSLRWLKVIARETSFRPEVVNQSLKTARRLNVSYVLSGQVDFVGPRVRIYAELASVETSSIQWSARYEGPGHDLLSLLDDTAAAITTALDSQIRRLESQALRRQPLASLDAWGCYHRAFDLMHRFTQKDNARAAQLLNQSIRLAPDFCRAYAALSFTHSQDAFMGYTSSAKDSLAKALKLGNRSVELDDRDPYAHFTLGRVHWFSGRIGESRPFMQSALDLCPSFAQGYYARALINALLDHGAQAAQDGQQARRLSPLDPLRWAMHGATAIGHLVTGDLEQALSEAERGAYDPSAHEFMYAVAYVAADSIGDQSRKKHWFDVMQSGESPMTETRFLSRFPFRGAAIRQRVERAFRSPAP